MKKPSQDKIVGNNGYKKNIRDRLTEKEIKKTIGPKYSRIPKNERFGSKVFGNVNNFSDEIIESRKKLASEIIARALIETMENLDKKHKVSGPRYIIELHRKVDEIKEKYGNIDKLSLLEITETMEAIEKAIKLKLVLESLPIKLQKIIQEIKYCIDSNSWEENETI